MLQITRKIVTKRLIFVSILETVSKMDTLAVFCEEIVIENYRDFPQ